jgi:hypothetical protein
MITDLQRSEFLAKLHASMRAKNGVLLPDWESAFLASWLAAMAGSRWFTDGRRMATDKMWMRFGGEINWPHPLDTVALTQLAIADADADGCQYLVREDGRQRRCNDPATCREPGKLRYCDCHAQAVERDCKRAGIKFCLVAFRSETLNIQHSTLNPELK